MKARALARYWDGLIACHIAAGDDVSDVAREFGLRAYTVYAVSEEITGVQRAAWITRERARARRALA
jgi:AraC-like DNA-binding protein